MEENIVIEQEVFYENNQDNFDPKVFYNKHYITIDENFNIINGFSEVFKTPNDSDICINEFGARHFVIDGVENPCLIQNNLFLYKYINGEIVKKSEVELSQEIENSNQIPTKQITEEEKAIDMMKFLMNNDEFLTIVGITPISQNI